MIENGSKSMIKPDIYQTNGGYRAVVIDVNEQGEAIGWIELENEYARPTIWWISGGHPQSVYDINLNPEITVSETKLPEPLRGVPKFAEYYWSFDPTEREGMVTAERWENANVDYDYLRSGCAHRTRENAEAWADFWRKNIIKGGE